jgi:hypothetical protein
MEREEQNWRWKMISLKPGVTEKREEERRE